MVNWEQVINEMDLPEPKPAPQYKIGPQQIRIGGRMVELDEHVDPFDGMKMGYRASHLDNDML